MNLANVAPRVLEIFCASSRVCDSCAFPKFPKGPAQSQLHFRLSVQLHFIALTSSILSLHWISDCSSLSVTGCILPNGLT